MTRPLNFDPAELVRVNVAFSALVDAAPDASSPAWATPAEALVAALAPLGVGPTDVARACRLAGVPILNRNGRPFLPLGGVGFRDRLREVVLGRVTGAPMRWRPVRARERVLGTWGYRQTWRRSIVRGYGSFQADSIGGKLRPRSPSSASPLQGPSTAPPEVFE